MIYMPYRPYVNVRLRPLKLLLCHRCLLQFISMMVLCLLTLLPVVTNTVKPTTGLEPVNLFLTKEVLYLLSYVGRYVLSYMERETGFEPATLSLEG